MQVLDQNTAAQIKAAQASTDNTVATQLAARKDTDTVLLDGVPTDRLTAVAEVTRRQAESRHAYFDPQDMIDELSSPNLKYEMRRSLAWTIDTMCISAARTVFRQMRTTKSDSIDDMAEFINQIAEIKANEAYNVDLGFEENSGSLQSLSILLVLREQWHDLAETSAKALGIVYAPRTLEELIAAEKQQTVGEDLTANLQLKAKLATRKHPDRYEAVLTLMVKRENELFKKYHQANVLTAPAVISIFGVADYRRDREEVAFHELSQDTQVRIANRVRGAAERAVDDLARRRSVSTTAYAVLCTEAFDLMDKIDDVIASKIE